MEITLPFVVLKTKWDVICGQVLWEVHARACPQLVVVEGVRGLPDGGGGAGVVQQRSVLADAASGRGLSNLTVPQLGKKIQVH